MSDTSSLIIDIKYGIIYNKSKGGVILDSVITLAAPYMRYIMLFTILYIVVRMLVAMFCKKTTNPLRGKLVNAITGEEIPLYDRETSLGRNKKCDINLPFDTISRLHAVITFRSKGFMVFDTFSKSGVLVNGEKIKSKAYVHHGDVISLGGLDYTLHEARYKFIKDKSSIAGRPSYGIILFLLALFNICSLLLNLFHGGESAPQIIGVYVGFILLQWVYFAFATYVLRIHNFELEMIAFSFASVGLAIVGSIYPGAVLKQFLAVVVGVVGLCYGGCYAPR